MIDIIDKKILAALQTDSRQSIAEISQIAGLSISACHRRISLLEKNGIIENYSARLNGVALGYLVMFFVEISLESQSDAVLSAFERAAHKQEEVLECHLMTGSADYLLKIAAQDTQNYEKIYRRVIASLPHVSKIQSSLVMKTIKAWNGYPL